MKPPGFRFSTIMIGPAYFAAASAALSLTRFDGGVAFLWPAASILVAFLTVRRQHKWPAPILACAIASVIATGLFGFGWALAVPFAIANMAEAAIAARLLRRARYADDQLGSVRWLVHFVLCVGVAAPLASATIAASALLAAGRPAGGAFVHFAVGHALGNITFIPIMSLFISGRLKHSLRVSSRSRGPESAILLLLVAATTIGVFSQSALPLLFLPMLPLILTTFRMGQGGAAAAIVIVAVIGGGFTMAGSGPASLVDGPLGSAMQFVQFYLAATVLTVLSVAADLRTRARLHRELRLSEERYRLLADHSTDIVMHLEADGRIRFVSPSIKHLGGYEPEALIGKNTDMLIAPEHIEFVRAAHAATIAAAGNTQCFDYEGITRDGQRRWFETHSRAVIGEDGHLDGVLSHVRDVSERKAIEQRLTTAALTDSLTNLPNRRAFRDAIEQLHARPGSAEAHSVAIFDIDHFKRVNDKFGHDAGDAVLCAFARLVVASLRPGDRLFRLGGEEFAALLPRTTVDHALVACERVRADVAAASMSVAGHVIRITVSGGVAAIGERGVDAALKNADAALYQAKAAGRDQLHLAA